MSFLENKVKDIIISALNDPEIQREVQKFANRAIKEIVRTQAEKLTREDNPVFKKP